MEWKVGQQVYCLRYGEGEIIHIDRVGDCSVKVKFLHGGNSTYTVEGYWAKGDKTLMLYPSKPEIILPKWQPKEGEWCWFWDGEFEGCYVKRFKKMAGGEYKDTTSVSWQNCAPFVGELPEYLKEVQP
jgi:hypothetical protein